MRTIVRIFFLDSVLQLVFSLGISDRFRDIVISAGRGEQLRIRAGCAMTMPASIIQADLTGRQAAIFIELADLASIDSHHVGAHIAHEAINIRSSALDQARHMAISASDVERYMARVILELGFLPVAILAEQVRGLQTLLA